MAAYSWPVLGGLAVWAYALLPQAEWLVQRLREAPEAPLPAEAP